MDPFVLLDADDNVICCHCTESNIGQKNCKGNETGVERLLWSCPANASLTIGNIGCGVNNYVTDISINSTTPLHYIIPAKDSDGKGPELTESSVDETCDSTVEFELIARVCVGNDCEAESVIQCSAGQYKLLIIRQKNGAWYAVEPYEGLKFSYTKSSENAYHEITFKGKGKKYCIDPVWADANLIPGSTLVAA